MISGVIKFGSIDDILYRSIPSILSSFFIRSSNFSPVLLPKSPVFTPVRTTSFMPLAAISFASFKIKFLAHKPVREQLFLQACPSNEAISPTHQVIH
jgi:hypothetical protein